MKADLESKLAGSTLRVARVGARQGGGTARLFLEGRWLEERGFQPGATYRVQEYGSGILLLPTDSVKDSYPLGEPASQRVLSYEPWQMRLRLEKVQGDQPPTYINEPQDAYLLLRDMKGMDREHVLSVLLGARNQVLGVDTVSVGGLNSCGVEPREVFKAAIHSNSAALILAHNHPSGDPEPSQDDVRITKRLRQAGGIVGISVLDHLVVAGDDYVSLRERGYIG